MSGSPNIAPSEEQHAEVKKGYVEANKLLMSVEGDSDYIARSKCSVSLILPDAEMITDKFNELQGFTTICYQLIIGADLLKGHAGDIHRSHFPCELREGDF